MDAGRTVVEGRSPETGERSVLPVPPGTILAGKYRVDDVIASGGMGVVASGEHIKLSQRVAIKFLRSWTVDGVARFEREARACARIQSEHIVRVLDVDVLPNGTPFMVMELLEGTDLSLVLKERGHVLVAEAVDYVLQSCEALAEAHRNEIIHRDLKPANIFLTHRPDGTALVKVLDFGISKIRSSDGNPVDELTTTNALMGSPSYMSPEQLRAAKNVDARADVWGLGAVLYKLVSGRNPFVADSTAELCMKILTERPAPLDDIDLPKELRDVIEQCLDKDRDHRYANVAELAEALRPWGAGESVDRVVRTLGAVVRPFHERTPSRGIDGAADTRLATTVDPSVSDAQRPSRSWRAPVGIVVALGVLVVTVGVVTHKTAPPPLVVSEAVRTSVTPSVISTDTPAPTLELSTLTTPTASALVLPHVTTVTPAQTIPRTAVAGALVRSFPTTIATTRTPPTNPTATATATATSNEFERFGDRK